MAEATTKRSSPRRRMRGEGSVYQSADGRWHGAMVTTEPATGARRRYAVSGSSQAVVRDKMAVLRTSLATTGRPTSRTSLADYLTTWIAAEQWRVRNSTWRGRELHVRSYIIPAIGKIPLADLRPSDVERLTDGIIASGRSGLTARHARTTLRRALADAERDGLINRNVASLSRPPRVERHAVTVLTADETRRLIDGAGEDEDGPLFVVAASTGLRQGELLGLAWDDVDLEGFTPTLTVRRALVRTATGTELAEPKTARSRRTIELGPVTVRALRRRRTRQKESRLATGDLWQDRDGLVFTDPIGRRMAARHVAESFSLTLARLGLPHVRFHDLRHGYASLLLAQGVPLRLVSEQLGHSTLTITADIYTHLDREQRRQAADAIERAIGGEA
jgi:integrase